MSRFISLGLGLLLMVGIFRMQAAMAAQPGGQAGQGELAYAIYLRVNGRPITQDHVAQTMRYLVNREYKDQGIASEEEALNVQNAAIRDLVRSYLIHSEANRSGVKLDRETARRASQVSGLRPDEITPTIRRILEADDLFDELMMAEGTPVRTPSPKEVRDFYLSNRENFTMDAYIIVREIFIGYDGRRAESHFIEQGQKIIQEIEAASYTGRTEAFIKAAGEHSQDIFAEVGGLLTNNPSDPWMPRDFANEMPDGTPIFPQPMVDGIKSLSVKGEIRLVTSEDGVHLLYLEDTRGGNVMPWDEAKRLIEYLLKHRRRNEAMRNWINRIYDRSDVRWHNGNPYDKALLTQVMLPSERGMQ